MGRYVQYSYTPDGRLAKRTWARKIADARVTTDYDYYTGQETGLPFRQAAGSLKSVTYSDC